MTRLKSLAALTPTALAVVLVATVSGPAPAQPRPEPAGATPPAAPAAPPDLPPPPLAAGDPELEPQVTITRRKSETVEEARVNGRVVWIKVTPLHGKPYFLVPSAGGTAFVRRDSLDTGLMVPLWELLTF